MSPVKMERRKRGKSDTIDADSSVHAASSRIRTVTPKTRSGIIEALPVLKACRKTAIAARRNALQMIQMNIVACFAPFRSPKSVIAISEISNIVFAPDELRDQIRHAPGSQQSHKSEGA